MYADSSVKGRKAKEGVVQEDGRVLGSGGWILWTPGWCPALEFQEHKEEE